MPTPQLYAVRANLDLQEKQAYRLIAHVALDDMSQARLKHQWSHPNAAKLLGVSGPFTAMLGNYLTYRRAQRVIVPLRGIRPHGPSCAQLFLYEEKDHPLDLINLGTSGDRTEQMARLLEEATYRKVLVEPDTVKTVENMLSRACGMAWETIVDTFQRHQLARNTTTTSTTAMGEAA
jgi:hypothetical protein